ncbi:MAG: hypothetical protein RJAPGHWK_002637 [Candidatus Fervidibacter sp.]
MQANFLGRVKSSSPLRALRQLKCCGKKKPSVGVAISRALRALWLATRGNKGLSEQLLNTATMKAVDEWRQKLLRP